MQMQALQSFYYQFRQHLDYFYVRLFYYGTLGHIKANFVLLPSIA